MKIEFTIPMTKDLIKEANRSGEHWTKKKKRHDTQKLLIRSAMNHYLFEDIPRPCIVIMTRIAPRELDWDNLVYSFKWIRDELASDIIDKHNHFLPGRCDSDPRMSWEYRHQKGKVREYAVKIEIKSRDFYSL